MEVAVVVIAKDAQATLSKCLTSVASLTDEVLVVVDDRSTDDTDRIAKDFGARVVFNKFTDFSSQRNFAASLVSRRWIFSLDADEVATPELVTAIKSLPENQLYAAFSIPRKNIIFKKIINYTNWDPNGLIRLYDKTRASWQGLVHESIVTESAVEKLYDPIIHYNYQTVEQFMQKQNDYSTKQAEEIIAQKSDFSLIKFVLLPLVDFLRRYVLHTGFLDGWHGFFLSYLMVIYHLSVWIKVWQKKSLSSSS